MSTAYFDTQAEAFAFADGLITGSDGGVHSVEVMIPSDDRPYYVVWIDEANKVRDDE